MTAKAAASPTPRDTLALLNLPRDEWTALERWTSGGVAVHTLPSGIRVAGRVMRPEEMLTDGLLHEDQFRTILAALADSDDGPAAAAGPALAFIAARAAAFVRYVEVDESFVPFTLTVDAFGSLSVDDRNALERIADDQGDAP